MARKPAGQKAFFNDCSSFRLPLSSCNVIGISSFVFALRPVFAFIGTCSHNSPTCAFYIQLPLFDDCWLMSNLKKKHTTISLPPPTPTFIKLALIV